MTSFRWCRFYFFVQVEWKATTVQTAVSVNRSVIWISVCLPLAVAPVMEVAFLFGLKSHCWACQASSKWWSGALWRSPSISWSLCCICWSCWSLLCPDRALFICVEEPCFLLSSPLHRSLEACDMGGDDEGYVCGFSQPFTSTFMVS